MSKAWAGGSTTAWKKVRRLVLERDGYRCQIRGPRCLTIATQADHIVLKSQGGTDHPDNLRASCGPCNQSAKRSDPEPRGAW